jgi:hypothetical protein
MALRLPSIRRNWGRTPDTSRGTFGIPLRAWIDGTKLR